jgi:hypothetical protein
MCDYSLEHLTSRPANLNDRLVVTKFASSCTRAFTASERPDVVVCLRPGTELAFESAVTYRGAFWLRRTADSKVARFRQINLEVSHDHHDAVEFPDGTVVKLTRLTPGQHATVLQLPNDRSTNPIQSRLHATAIEGRVSNGLSREVVR